SKLLTNHHDLPHQHVVAARAVHDLAGKTGALLGDDIDDATVAIDAILGAGLRTLENLDSLDAPGIDLVEQRLVLELSPVDNDDRMAPVRALDRDRGRPLGVRGKDAGYVTFEHVEEAGVIAFLDVIGRDDRDRGGNLFDVRMIFDDD